MVGGDTCCWVGLDFPKDVLWLVWISWTTWCHSHLKSYQDQTFHLGSIFSSLQIHGRFFQNGNLSIVLDGWYGIHSWNKIAWSLWLKRPCLGWFLTPQNHRKSMGLKMIFVPTFPIWVGRFFEKNNPWTFLQMSIPWKDFPPQNLLGAKCQPCHFPTKPTRTAPCMAPPVAPNPGPAAPPAPAAPPVPATAPATAPAVPQAEPQGGPVGSQMEDTSKIWESIL